MTFAAVTSIPKGHIRLGIDEYMELPNDGKRYQIIDGVLDVTPAPNTKHQGASKKLEWSLITALEKTGLGYVFDAPIDVVLDPHNIVQPDLIFVRKERADIITVANIQGAPDLVIEILSPSTRRTDVLIKSELYARFGVPLYWIVDPDLERIETYRLVDKAYEQMQVATAPSILEPVGFPGLQIDLREIFSVPQRG